MTEQDRNIKNGGSAGGNHILESIDRIENKVDKVEKRQHEYEMGSNTEITAIKTKAGIMGTIGGVVGSVIVSIVIAVSASFISDKVFDDNIKKLKQEENKIEKRLDKSPTKE